MQEFKTVGVKKPSNFPIGFHCGDITQEKLTQYLTVEGIFGSKPIAELFPSVTVMFADVRKLCIATVRATDYNSSCLSYRVFLKIVGFTAW